MIGKTPTFPSMDLRKGLTWKRDQPDLQGKKMKLILMENGLCTNNLLIRKGQHKKLNSNDWARIYS